MNAQADAKQDNPTRRIATTLSVETLGVDGFQSVRVAKREGVVFFLLRDGKASRRSAPAT